MWRAARAVRAQPAAIVVPSSNPGKRHRLADFGKSSLKIAVCAVAVPCGAAADKVFKASGSARRSNSYEQDVKGC